MEPNSVAARAQHGQEGEGPPLPLEDVLVQLRRRSDWTGKLRDGDEASAAAYRGALDVATATLAAHDYGTASHSDDVTTLSLALAEQLGMHGRDRAYLLAAAELHDIGKVGIPSQILSKPGPLEEQEWAAMRSHTVTGEQILGSVPELAEVGRIVRHCHERWDGDGYPDGVAGEQIPLAARIVFCADAFHAIRGERPYRRGRSAQAALAEVRKNSGTQFDPTVVEALGTVALRVRGAHRRRLTAIMGGRRSQRLAALLLTLVVAGGALAATGVWSPKGKASADGGEGAAASPGAVDRPRDTKGSTSGAQKSGSGPTGVGAASKDRAARGASSSRGSRSTAAFKPAARGGGREGAASPRRVGGRAPGARRDTRARPPSRRPEAPARPESRPSPPRAPATSPPAPPAATPQVPSGKKPSSTPQVAPPGLPVLPVGHDKPGKGDGHGYGHVKGVGKHLGHED